MLLVDTHAHLSDPQFDSDRTEALSRAGEKEIRAIVEIADEPTGWNKARQLAADPTAAGSPHIFWACGFHPHFADEGLNFDFKSMNAAGMDARCVAVGEIGLDYVKSKATRDVQIETFRKALEAAAEINKPVVIHCREAQADMLRILKSFFGGTSRRDFATGVIHCFSGDRNFAEGCLDLGFYLGVDGPITYPGAHGLRDVIQNVPIDRIVLETDCPYLPPQNFRGQRNEPSYLGHIAEKISALFGRPLEEISQITTQNAMNLFRLHALLK